MPFGDLGVGEILVVAVVALFVYGPERLPQAAADLGKMLRSVRKTVRGLTADLKDELGPEVADLDLASLNPRTFVRKHLLEDDPDDLHDELRTPARRSQRSLAAGEPAPWDPDTT